MGKKFSEVPPPLFSFLNGEDDEIDSETENHSFSRFWEWVLFGDVYTKEKDYNEKKEENDEDEEDEDVSNDENEDDYNDDDSANRGEGENQLSRKVEITVDPARLKELTVCWKQLIENRDIKRALRDEGLQRPAQLDAALLHGKLVRLLFNLDGKPLSL